MVVILVVLGIILLSAILVIALLFRHNPGRRNPEVGSVFLCMKELEKSMDGLLKEHPVSSSINELYLLISLYADCRNITESNYCKNYLKRKTNAAYFRYDTERLK